MVRSCLVTWVVGQTWGTQNDEFGHTEVRTRVPFLNQLLK